MNGEEGSEERASNDCPGPGRWTPVRSRLHAALFAAAGLLLRGCTRFRPD